MYPLPSMKYTRTYSSYPSIGAIGTPTIPKDLKQLFIKY